MANQASSSAGGSGRSLDQPSLPVIATIDDAVSLIRSIEAAPDASQSASMSLVPIQIYDILLPALKRLYHSQKGKGQRVLVQALQGGIDPLGMLDPARNSLGYAYILACRTSQATTADAAQTLTDYIDLYARYFTPAQLVGAGEIVTVLARNIANIGQLLQNPIAALTSLVRLFDGFRSVQGGPNNLTTLHPILVYQCLRAQHYNAAIDWVLTYDIISADDQITPLVYTDVLEYLYFGAMVWARVNRLDKACEFFELCVTSPAQQVSAIQIDAYKKLLLVQLLKDGKTSPLPRYTSQCVNRAVRGKIASVDLYQNIAQAYEAEPVVQLYSKDIGEIRHQGYVIRDNVEREISRTREVLKRDLNVGLIKQVMENFTRRRIQRLSRLFNRMKVGHLVDLLGATVDGTSGDEACRLTLDALRRMDHDRWIALSIESHDSTTPLSDVIVHFSQSDVDHSGLEAAHRLTKIMQEAKFWDQVVDFKQKAVRHSEAYLSKQVNPMARGGFGSIPVEDLDDDAFS